MPFLDKNQFDSVVFDVDGLLVNSEPVILYTILETGKNYIKEEYKTKYLELAEEIKLSCFGRSEDAMCKEFFNFLNSRQMLRPEVSALNEKEFFDKFVADRTEKYIDFCKDGLFRPMPGAVDFVLKCFDTYGPLAINTGSPQILSEPMLYSAFSQYFDVDLVFPKHLRTFVSDLGHGFGKPSPDGYIRAANLLGYHPSRLIAVVDRGNDCQSALRAQYSRVLVVYEDQDLNPLQLSVGKHSLTAFIRNQPELERKKFAEKVTGIGGRA